MMISILTRKLALACTLLLLSELASSEPGPDKWEQGRVEQRRNTLNMELKALKRSRELELRTKQSTDTTDLALKLVQEELDVLADGRAETKEERLTRTLSNYKRQRALGIKLGQNTSGFDKMIASAERQLKGQPTNFTKKTHIDNKRASAEGKLKQQLGIREQALKYGRSTARADEQIAQLREGLAIMNSGKDPETINIELQILGFERSKKTYQKSGHDASHIDRQIESLQRKLRGEPLKASNPPSKPEKPTSKPEKPSSKPKPPMSEKMRQAKIRGLQHGINSLQKSIERIEAQGRPAPQGFVDSLAKKKAELAELQK